MGERGIHLDKNVAWRYHLTSNLIGEEGNDDD